MMNFDASAEDASVVHCAVCEKAITGGGWFAKVNRGGHVIALCCPLCMEAFEANPSPYLRRIEMYSRIKEPELPSDSSP